MASLSLPAPRRIVVLPKVSDIAAIPSPQPLATTVLKAPSYEERCRTASEAARLTPEQRKKLFLPRSLADFDDGGAFPEIHIAQYPRHMGNPHLNRKVGTVRGTQQSSSAIVNVEIDKDGEISYDSLVKSGTNADKKVYTKLDDMIGGPVDPDAIALPTSEEQQAATERTALALQSLLASHTALSKPSGSAMVNAETSKNIEAKTQFIKYTPRKDAPGYNPAAAQRVIQMVPAQVDPMVSCIV
jgi:SNW domain-containing protein 1